MNPARLLAVSRKEFLHLSRDPRSVIMAIAIPMLLLFLFGYALNLDVDHVPLVVWDQDETPLSREYVSLFGGTPYFSIQGHRTGYRELERDIDNRDALIALVIPAGFEKALNRGRDVAVQLILDGSDPNTASIALGYAEIIHLLTGSALPLRAATRVAGSSAPLAVRARVWYNSELVSRNYIFPGLIAMVMMIISALLTSLTIAREWENGTMEQLLSTPVRREEILLGKLLPYLALGFLDMVLSVLMGYYLFQVPMRGHPALVILFSFIFLVGAMLMGLFLSVVTRSQFVASQVAMVGTFLPAFLLSGLVFAIANMPAPIQFITYFVPARYFITIMRDLYLKGVGVSFFLSEALLLTLFAAVMLAIVIKKFEKKLVTP